MTGDPDVIGLLQRADWTRLSLAARVNDGSTVLVAPGRRYREETAEGIRGCDGEHPWTLPPWAADGTEHWNGGPEPPLRTLLCPAWLLRDSRLEVRGPVRACGREAMEVMVTARESPRDVTSAARSRIGRTEAIVDAELGILLRVARDGGRQVTELVSLDVNPVIHAGQFMPPPGSRVGESLRSARDGDPFAAVWKTAAGITAGGLDAWHRYSPFGRGRVSSAADPEAAMPRDDPAPEMAADGGLAGPPVGDDVLHVLHGGGTAAFAATLHQWLDPAALLGQVPDTVRRTGFGGLGLLASALGEPAAAPHLVSSLRIGGPGRYQIDHRYDPGRGPKTIACDGQRRWRVYRYRLTAGPPQPLPSDLADLADASWLLECRLSDGTLVMAGDRPAYRVNVARGDAPWSLSLMFSPAVAVVDAELGILLSLTSYLGGRPVRRYELRDVAGPVSPGDFRVHLPPGLRLEQETDPLQGVRDATKAARDFLRRMGLS